jgi:hypothetical protein
MWEIRAMQEENIYKTPEARLSVESYDESECLFFPVSRTKLIILFIATFGVYSIYWFYKNWKLQQKCMKEKVNPALRSIFYIFFTHSLFRRIEAAAIKEEIPKSWNANVLATVFVILSIVSNVLDRISQNNETIGIVDYVSVLMVFILLYPLYMVQEVVNKVNGDPHGKLNSSFSIYNVIFIVIGVFLWFLVGIGFFQSDINSINQLYQ